jgi:hypothetical protein
MKILDIILENTDYSNQEDSLARDIRNATKSGELYVSMGDYVGGRSDDDPLKDMSFGKVTFKTQSDFDPKHWSEIIKFIESKGYEITSDSNYADSDDDRYYYPTIKFHFKTPTK